MKAKSIILKIIIVVALIGILVVTGIIIIRNRNIQHEAYNTINVKISENNFEPVSTGANALRSSYEGPIDEFSVYVDDIIGHLNEGIDFYLNYLSLIEDVSRGEQDKLIDKYVNYVNALIEAEDALKFYNETYEKSAVEETIKRQIPALSGTFVLKYNTAYQKGSEFFKELVLVVNKYLYESAVVNNGIEMRHILINAFSDRTIAFVENNMESRIQMSTNLESLSDNQDYKNFVALVSSFDTFEATDALINDIGFNGFALNASKIDIVKLIVEDTEYYNTLTEEQKTVATSVNNYLTAKFGVIIQGGV